MLIVDKHAKPIKLKSLFSWCIAFVALLLLGYYVLYPSYLLSSTRTDKERFFCDAERVYKRKFISNGQRFSFGELQSKAQAKTGKYSCKVTKASNIQYGFGFDLSQFNTGDHFEVAVWALQTNQVGKVAIAISGTDESPFYQEFSEVARKENGWNLIKGHFQVPHTYTADKIKIYTFTDGKDEVYLDDLSVKKIVPANKNTSAFLPQKVKIQLKEKNYNRLHEIRANALQAGVLISNDDSWVKGQLETGDDRVPVKLRLKGDWLDQLESNKWSFRVSTKTPNTWNRLKTFSFHSPKARAHTWEWLLHQFWMREDVLTPRYDFIQLSLNDESLGVYAYEEHFEKQLVEYQARREGPIVKFMEDALWDARRRQIETLEGRIDNENKPNTAEVKNAEIKPFKESKTIASATLANQFDQAQTLMYQYQQGLKKPADVFDLDRLAKYHAIADLLGAYHALIWHNQRFYYNPVLNKLEPIGYDGFSGGAINESTIFADYLFKTESAKDTKINQRVYEDEAFIKKYMHYLNRFTTDAYLADFYNQIKDDLDSRNKLIAEEFKGYNLSFDRILKRAKKARASFLPYQEHSLKAQWTTEKDGEKILSIQNMHEMPLEIIGFGTSSTAIIKRLEEGPILAPNRRGISKTKKSISAPEDARYVFYQAIGIDSVFHTSISPWKAVKKQTPYQELSSSINFSDKDYLVKNGNVIRFKKGDYQIMEDIIIPENYSVNFEAGVHLDFIKKAKFISFSPVYMNGTKAEPIIIKSSDQSMNGFSVLQAKGKSKVNQVLFSDMNTLNYKGWVLTGAVNFYESDVDISNSIVTKNLCEDALNIVRSTFDIDGITISHTFADGFDADFCKGTISNAYFEYTGNDGMDFSGSTISITNSKLLNCGDKGISVGEESRVNAKKVHIDGAVIGTASKDLSVLTVENITLKNCRQGFAAYQKKPEFGGSTIIVKSYTAEAVKYLHTIAIGSSLDLEGLLIKE